MKNNTLEQLTKTMKEVALKSGTIMKQNAFDPGHIQWKSFDDPVTNYDKDTEKLFNEELNKIIPINIIGEEYGKQQVNSDYTLVIDPIDGTKSFIRGEFNSSIAAALQYKDDLVYSIVYDFMRDLMYVADEEGVHGELTTTKQIFPLNRSIGLKTTTLYVHDDNNKYLSKLSNLKNISTRNAVGSVALNLAHIAIGAIDGMISQPYKSEKTDTAASYYLLKQAGIQMYDFNGNTFDWHHPENGMVVIRPEKKDILDKLLH